MAQITENPLIAKLSQSGFLKAEDFRRLKDLAQHVRKIEGHVDLIHQGDRPEEVHLVLDGWAARYKMLPSGNRQIMALLLPGDFCDLHIAILKRMDHSIGTVSPCTIVNISRSTIEELSMSHPRIMRALWWATLVDEAVLREWLTNIGQRSAIHRLAHFLCEMLVRLQLVGHAGVDSFRMPITQSELGDILGLSVVHVNRSIQDLRNLGLVATQQRYVSFPNVARCMEYCGFELSYLHLNPRPAG